MLSQTFSLKTDLPFLMKHIHSSHGIPLSLHSSLPKSNTGAPDPNCPLDFLTGALTRGALAFRSEPFLSFSQCVFCQLHSKAPRYRTYEDRGTFLWSPILLLCLCLPAQAGSVSQGRESPPIRVDRQMTGGVEVTEDMDAI